MIFTHFIEFNQYELYIRLWNYFCSLLVEDWCIRNKYELVELKPKIDAEDCETDFEECYGIDRVKEILSSHQWPNLVMKGS